jgi:hypothetical protein
MEPSDVASKQDDVMKEERWSRRSRMGRRAKKKREWRRHRNDGGRGTVEQDAVSEAGRESNG